MNALPMAPLRPPFQVMRLERLGAMHRTRLSFVPSLLRRMAAQNWRVTRPLWEMDENGFGRAVYTVTTAQHRYSLVAFSNDLPPEQRTDRVIAERWDTSFVLYDGVPDQTELARLAANAPLQEVGRFTERDLVLSRANKSVRLFDAVVAALAAGNPPDAAALQSVGYLMRTTAVYGNGKFGIADRDVYAERDDLSGPFTAEMLTVWLIRGFTIDLATHCAGAASAGAMRLNPLWGNGLGVGNSTGLGMAPFLVRHPILLHHWMVAREQALARVRAAPHQAETWEIFSQILHRAPAELSGWRTGDPTQQQRTQGLIQDVETLIAFSRNQQKSWDSHYRFAERELGVEAQEYLISLLLEPHGALIDDLADTMAVKEDEARLLDGGMRCGQLLALIQRDYAWCLTPDSADAVQARFWYVSEEKLEPRLGTVEIDSGADKELPLRFALDIAALARLLRDIPTQEPVAKLLSHALEFRHVVRRVQLVARYPYAEIQGNLVGPTIRPIDLLRCKLSFFGATRFDPRSDLWLRISLFQNEILPRERAEKAQDWHG